jgi:hypothetical protein
MRKLVLNIPDAVVGQLWVLEGFIDKDPIRIGVNINPDMFVLASDKERTEVIRHYMVGAFAELADKLFSRGY